MLGAGLSPRSSKEPTVAFPGIHHVAITVTDLERSTAWYTRVFGGGPVLDEDEESGTFHHTVFALDGGMRAAVADPGGDLLERRTRSWLS
jgi:catechol 2,3-dioxygenase-like lactoylglutathione lyase family enzyme